MDAICAETGACTMRGGGLGVESGWGMSWDEHGANASGATLTENWSTNARCSCALVVETTIKP